MHGLCGSRTASGAVLRVQWLVLGVAEAVGHFAKFLRFWLHTSSSLAWETPSLVFSPFLGRCTDKACQSDERKIPITSVKAPPPGRVPRRNFSYCVRISMSEASSLCAHADGRPWPCFPNTSKWVRMRCSPLRATHPPDLPSWEALRLLLLLVVP